MTDGALRHAVVMDGRHGPRELKRGRVSRATRGNPATEKDMTLVKGKIPQGIALIGFVLATISLVLSVVRIALGWTDPITGVFTFVLGIIAFMIGIYVLFKYQHEPLSKKIRYVALAIGTSAAVIGALGLVGVI